MDFALEEDMTPAVPEGAEGAGRENPAFYGEEDDLEVRIYLDENEEQRIRFTSKYQ